MTLYDQMSPLVRAQTVNQLHDKQLVTNERLIKEIEAVPDENGGDKAWLWIQTHDKKCIDDARLLKEIAVLHDSFVKYNWHSGIGIYMVLHDKGVINKEQLFEKLGIKGE
jgi:hypothetical protein